jgi:hypothetical protein
MAACLFLFWTLKREIAENEFKNREKRRALESAAGQLRATIEQLKLELSEAEARNAAAARPVAGMNLSKRGQALRMHKRGEKPEQIAAALELPANEVELLLKVHRQVVTQL